MSVETIHPEVASFLAGWQNKHSEQFAEELASYSLETHRIPDPYSFSITSNGELFSPSAHCKVKDIIYKSNHLGQLEYQALSFIEQWAANNDQGAVAWVSPPHPGVYPASKIIISEIDNSDGNKKLFNRALVVDFDEKECLEFTRKLSKLSLNRPLLTESDQVRSMPLILDVQSRSWVDILEGLIDDPILWRSIRNGEDRRAKEEALKRARIVQKDIFSTSRRVYTHEDQRAVLQMLGPRPGSCPVRINQGNGTAFQVFSENALQVNGTINSKDPDFCITCPVCQTEIKCVVKVGGSCPKCGAVKQCG